MREAERGAESGLFLKKEKAKVKRYSVYGLVSTEVLTLTGQSIDIIVIVINVVLTIEIVRSIGHAD